MVCGVLKIFPTPRRSIGGYEIPSIQAESASGFRDRYAQHISSITWMIASLRRKRLLAARRPSSVAVPKATCGVAQGLENRRLANHV